jgi:hypothetical protein
MKQSRCFASNLTTEYEGRIEVDAVFLQRGGITMMYGAQGLTNQRRCLERAFNTEETASVRLGNTLVQFVHDRLRDSKVAGGHQNEYAIARTLERVHLTKSVDVINTGVGARVRKKDEAGIE